MTIARIISAAERANHQFSPVHGSPEDNCAVLKELALDTLRAIHGLVEESGGDPDIIKTWIDGVPSDLDYAFADCIERASEPDYTDVIRPRYGLIRLLVEGTAS